MFAQKIKNHRIESRWIFDAAGMACSGNDMMLPTRDLPAHLTAPQERIIILAVSD